VTLYSDISVQVAFCSDLCFILGLAQAFPEKPEVCL